MAVLLSQLVQTSATLTVLSLAKNKLGGKGLKELVDGLSTNKTYFIIPFNYYYFIVLTW